MEWGGGGGVKKKGGLDIFVKFNKQGGGQSKRGVGISKYPFIGNERKKRHKCLIVSPRLLGT